MFTETTRYPGQQETGAYILITTLKKQGKGTNSTS